MLVKKQFGNTGTFLQHLRRRQDTRNGRRRVGGFARLEAAGKYTVRRPTGIRGPGLELDAAGEVWVRAGRDRRGSYRTERTVSSRPGVKRF